MTDKDTLIRQQHDFIQSMLFPTMTITQKTLRDEFAMAALPSMLSSKDCWTTEQAADLAYKIADAMLEARK